jgi:hypothetical protein
VLLATTTTLADGLQKRHGDFETAFQGYNDSLRQFVQAQAVNFGLDMFVPRSEALQRRNAHFNIG